MPIILKRGVDLIGAQPELLFGVQVVAALFEQRGVDCIVTSVRDGKHGPHSLHPFGYAADLRSWQLEDEDDKRRLVSEAKALLHEQYDVLYEPAQGERAEHFHMEVDPR